MIVVPGGASIAWVGGSYIMGQCSIQDSCPRVQGNDANDADFSDADADVEDVENLRG